MVSAFILCHFDYTCSFWYNWLTKHWKSTLQVTQNKLVRFVLNLDHRAHIEHTHFKQLNWLPVKDRVNQIFLCHVFKLRHGLSPKYMVEHFIYSFSTSFSKEGGILNLKLVPMVLKPLPMMNSFDKTEASVFSCRLCFLRVFPFVSLIILSSAI